MKKWIIICIALALVFGALSIPFLPLGLEDNSEVSSLYYVRTGSVTANFEDESFKLIGLEKNISPGTYKLTESLNFSIDGVKFKSLIFEVVVSEFVDNEFTITRNIEAVGIDGVNKKFTDESGVFLDFGVEGQSVSQKSYDFLDKYGCFESEAKTFNLDAQRLYDYAETEALVMEYLDFISDNEIYDSIQLNYSADVRYQYKGYYAGSVLTLDSVSGEVSFIDPDNATLKVFFVNNESFYNSLNSIAGS